MTISLKRCFSWTTLLSTEQFVELLGGERIIIDVRLGLHNPELHLLVCKYVSVFTA